MVCKVTTAVTLQTGMAKHYIGPVDQLKKPDLVGRLKSGPRPRGLGQEYGLLPVFKKLPALEIPVNCHSDLMEDPLRNIEPVQPGVEQMCQLLQTLMLPTQMNPTIGDL